MNTISVGLQKSLVVAQNKLWMAIQQHQNASHKVSGNLNEPHNKHLRAEMKMIEIKILEIDKWQKDLYSQLRKEVAAQNSETALDAARHLLAEALKLNKLNNNNHIIHNGENTTLVNGHASSSSNISEDEESPSPPLPLPPPPSALQQNGDVATTSPIGDENSATSSKGQEASTSGSAEESGSPEPLSEEEPGALLTAETEDKKQFLGRLGLISHALFKDIAVRMSQRKRRRNVRSQFLYSPPQPAPKRKRHAYLQSGNAPQTRQTTARQKGPSPTLSAKSASSNGRGGGSSTKASTAKSLSQATKTTANSVLRNGDVAAKQQIPKEFSIKQKTDIGDETMKISTMGKTLQIPGLPAGLTVEWIDKNSTVCISCRNPGSLSMCESCSLKFHVSCHTVSPASTSHCPKCVTRFPVKAISCVNELQILRHEVKHVKKEYRDTGAAGESSRAQGKGGENTELHKALGELYKADAAHARQQQQQSLVAFDIKQLPPSTLLIPITSSTSGITSASHDDDNSNFGSNSGFSGDMAEIVRQLPETSVTTTGTRNEWRRLALQSSGLVQSRSSSESSSINPKHQSISILQHDLPHKSSTGTRQQSSRSLIKPQNYVTVKIVCDDEADSANDNSADSVYIESRRSQGVSEIVLESQPTIDEPAQQELEVFNISSGSSDLNTVDSPEPVSESKPSAEPTAAEESSRDDFDITAKSPESPSLSPKRNNESTTNVASQSPASCSPDEQHQQKQSDNVSDRVFLGTVFPGEFGYRIVIQYERPEVSSSDDDDHDGESGGTDDERQQQHVKLEEAHLPAPHGPELKTAVPDNKSDDTTSEGSTSVEKPTVQSEPTVTAD